MNLTQNKVELIGLFKPIDNLRYSRMGLACLDFVIVLPEENIKRASQIPCVVYKNIAEDLDKKILAGIIKARTEVRILGKLIIVYPNKYPKVVVHAKSIEVLEFDKSLFEIEEQQK